MFALVVSNYGSSTLSIMLMKYILRRKVKMPLLTHVELNLFQEMVKNGYVKLAEMYKRGKNSQTVNQE